MSKKEDKLNKSAENIFEDFAFDLTDINNFENTTIDTSNFEIENFDNIRIKKIQDEINKNKNRLNKKTNMIQSSIYAEGNVEILLRQFHKEINNYLLKNNNLKFRKINKYDIIENILQHYILKKGFISNDISYYENIEDRLKTEANKLLETSFKNLSYLEIIYKSYQIESNKRQNMYLKFDTLAKIIILSNFMFTNESDAKNILANTILKNFFIEAEIADTHFFANNNPDFLNLNFNDEVFENYFKLENQVHSMKKPQ